jgi:hypothetical protein
MGAYHSFSPLSFIISISMFREAADARLFVQYAPALHPLVENNPVIYIQRNTRGGSVNWARNELNTVKDKHGNQQQLTCLPYCIRIYGNPVSVKSNDAALGCKTFTRLSSQVKSKGG